MSTTTVADYRTNFVHLCGLAAVCAEPEDDTQRLKLADWLEENEQSERAEFIRRQVAPGYTPDWGDDQPRESAASGVGHLQTTEQRTHHDMFPGLLRLVGWNPSDVVVCYSAAKTLDALRVDVRFIRGFASYLSLSPADWFRHHHELYWAPEQTEECPELQPPNKGVYHSKKRGGLDYDRNLAHRDCRRCSGTGRIPRPVPPTAQPIETVRLTETPEFESHWRQGLSRLVGTQTWYKWDGIFVPETVPTLLAKEWPRIRFLLPGDEE